ncbi:hypothetical protein CDL12_24191 [Handroanthus impetiginosus]|uniref:CW-type domain-containing protein n=1 Tax=Handroanthus impetiginosus TaxID=429701 RepID=A0A2G9GDB7_9LAMI|nr:hypothetical protein CDL12_24191 [Handroanthus impetiginosus]
MNISLADSNKIKLNPNPWEAFVLNSIEYSSTTPKKVWEFVNLHAICCIICSKWRTISNKEKYEEIREKIVQKPFLCDTTHDWRPNVSCEEEFETTYLGNG